MNNGHFFGDPSELAALYAGGALTYEERVQFEAHLATGCQLCQAELDRLNSVLAALYAATEPMPVAPEIRARLLQHIAAAPSAGAASPLRARLDKVLAAEGQPAQDLLINRAAPARWESTDIPGVQMRVLFMDRANNQFTALVRMAPGTAYPSHIHSGPEECLVLEGALCVGDEVLHAGDYQRAPAGSCHGVQKTEQGCLLLITSSLTDVFV
jgi:predicted ChrR family anti-sigma factor